ncbi:MAG: thioredoxin [Nitrospinae bacterium]|nr:thioredoxin [Nitrospinota bacterium]
MAGAVESFTDDNFNAVVEKSGTLTLVDFWAEWCGPCRMLTPIVEQLANENTGVLKVGKLNVDENSKTATKYGIRSIPTLLFFKDGQIKGQIVGVRSKSEIQALIDTNK